MKKYLKRLGWICLPLLLIAIMMEVLLRNIPNDYLYKKEYLDAHAPEMETLILGSSHAFYGLDPVYFSSNTFNASHISQTLDYDYEILKKYQPQLTNLKTIVLPISSFTLFARMHKSLEKWRVKNYILYYKLKMAKSVKNYSEVLSIPLKYTLMRLASYYIKGTPEVTTSTLGWGTNYTSAHAKDLVETGKRAAFIHSGGLNIVDSNEIKKIFEENEIILNELLEWCKQKEVQILFVSPPGYKTYRENLNPLQIQITEQAMEQFALEHDNCSYLDLFADTTFIASDYYDADHLSEIGAEKLSKRVNFEIEKFEKYYGYSEEEIVESFNLDVNLSAKNKNYLLARAILGVTKEKIEEFEKAEIEVKTIKLEKNGVLKESMSFAQIKFLEIINEEWEESYLYTTLTRRFFFVVFKKDKHNISRLYKVKFWTMPYSDLLVAEEFWMDTKEKIIHGNYDQFWKLKDHRIFHVRPKGINSLDLMETPQGTLEKKKSYWLNSRYILKQITSIE